MEAEVLTTDVDILTRFQQVRQRTADICQPLETEDYVPQPVEHVSPPKWHLAHTTWFWEQFLLKKLREDFQPYHPIYNYLFNSYYEVAGKRVQRDQRGNFTRPTTEEIYEYRHHVDQQVSQFLNGELNNEQLMIVEVGLNHEQQHQELLITDLKYILGHNPLFPVYGNIGERHNEVREQKWLEVEKGLYEIGYDEGGFHWDNEGGRHRVWIDEMQISNKLVTNEEFQEFIEDGGYEQPEWWHSEGWSWINDYHIEGPLYWQGRDQYYTLEGLQKIQPDVPVTHISYYEAAAFANWRGVRLPTEQEWEVAQDRFEWGLRWEWTESSYSPYPGYSRFGGDLGEYNGKFMVNQKVLRGSSIATSPGHSRPTYRNFFHPHFQWQFTGIRLAR